jgi:hypothetical protein
MTIAIVTNQAEFDTALASRIEIRDATEVLFVGGHTTVRAYDSATVEASSHVAVHLHSAGATVAGGVVINISTLDLAQPAIWADYHGVEVEDGLAGELGEQ